METVPNQPKVEQRGFAGERMTAAGFIIAISLGVSVVYLATMVVVPSGVKPVAAIKQELSPPSQPPRTVEERDLPLAQIPWLGDRSTAKPESRVVFLGAVPWTADRSDELESLRKAGQIRPNLWSRNSVETTEAKLPASWTRQRRGQ